MQNKNQNKHMPVLLEQVIAFLKPEVGDSYFDGTAGYGGHARRVVEAVGPTSKLVFVDQDTEAIAALSAEFSGRATIVHSDYTSAARACVEAGEYFRLVCLDLGVSSPQFDNYDRGFSFRGTARLDMRMDRTQELSAYEVVNSYRESELVRIISQYGEERRARAVARAIVAARPLETTKQLADTIRGVVRYAGDIDPATRTFQAIRIEVNDELDRLAEALPLLVDMLEPGGRLAIISFHSLEDRLVKTYFEQESRDCICPPKQPVCTCTHQARLSKLTKKPTLGKDYDASNPRARSAVLRAVVKLTPKPKE
jgi:16S rRNA (cytosine1402-N4)-methyltransferase